MHNRSKHNIEYIFSHLKYCCETENGSMVAAIFKTSFICIHNFYLSHNSSFLFSLHLLLLPLTHMHWERVGGGTVPLEKKVHCPLGILPSVIN